MHQQLVTHNIECPYCDQNIELLIDCSVAHQQYIEDCQVCCRPIELTVRVDREGAANVVAVHENE